VHPRGLLGQGIEKLLDEDNCRRASGRDGCQIALDRLDEGSSRLPMKLEGGVSVLDVVLGWAFTDVRLIAIRTVLDTPPTLSLRGIRTFPDGARSALACRNGERKVMSTKTTTDIFSGVAALLGLGPIARARVFRGKLKLFVGYPCASRFRLGITPITIRTRDTRRTAARFSFVL
jgi:hypothetical protein